MNMGKLRLLVGMAVLGAVMGAWGQTPTVIKTFSTVSGDVVQPYTVSASSSAPVQIEVYALGAGGGGQGASSWSWACGFLWLSTCSAQGTGGSGGGGGAGYIKLITREEATFNVKVGRGGSGGDHEFKEGGGTPGGTGGPTTVTWTQKNTTLTASGGGGGSGFSGGAGGGVSINNNSELVYWLTTKKGGAGNGGTKNGGCWDVSGGNSGSIENTGYYESYGNGLGGRSACDPYVARSSESGGGGYGRGANYAFAGSGGSGNVRIVVTPLHTISFNSNGGSVVNPITNIMNGTAKVANSSSANGTAIAKPANPTKDGYTFEGWWTTSAQTGGTEWNPANAVTSSVTYYARWMPIPSPGTTLTSSFDQWSKTVKLSWKYSNLQNLNGKFYVYRRQTSPTSIGWNLLSAVGESVANGANNATLSYSDNTIDYSRLYEYRVVFVAGSTAPNQSNPPENCNATNPASSLGYCNAAILVSTTPSLNTWTVSARGNNNNITVMLSGIDNRLTNSSDYSYTVDRSINGAAFASWLPNQSFKGITSYEHITEAISSQCDGYRYKVTIYAFGTTFIDSTKAETRITGATQFVKGVDSFKASKGELANQVRLQWRVNRLPSNAAPDIYRIFRQVANSNDKFTELDYVTSSAATVYWTDNNVLPGVFYDYGVILYEKCDNTNTEVPMESKFDIGFTQAFGTVSGRVTYGTGGIGSPGVNMLVKRNDLNGGERQYYSLKSLGGGQAFDFSTDNVNDIAAAKQWTLQFWVHPDITNIGANNLIGTLGSVNLQMDAVSGGYQIKADGVEASRSAIIPANRWSHISITRNGNGWKLYTVADQNPDSIYIVNAAFTTSAATSSGNFTLGRALKGNIDDVRFYNRPLTEAEIMRDYSRRLTGNENGLRGYWTFDYALPGYAFDMSRVGTVYNGNHAVSNTLVFDDNVPDETYQLALKGITDNNGNYQITGIPYTGEGTSYSIVPSLGVHKFNPTEQLRYVSPTSMVHNGADFTDVSSFAVSGNVVYGGGDYPVEGCSFEVDGVQVTSGGQPVTSGYDGGFTISVPIGVHKVQVKKSGHAFVNNGYLLDNGKDINYNKPLSNIEFQDTTRVKLIGHIVGGKLEHEKASGFGLRKNNIGSNELTLTAAKQGYRLATAKKEATFLHNSGDKWAKWTRSGGVRQDETNMSVFENTVTIHVSPQTGEYVAWVYPELYHVGNISAGDYGVIYNRNEGLDLREAAVMDDAMLKSSVYSWPDSVFVPRQGNRVEYYEHITRADTVRYHNEWSFYHQEQPSFTIKQLVNGSEVGYYGDKEYEIDENTKIDLVTLDGNGAPSYLFGKPVFRQGERYSFALSAFEEYRNPRTNVSMAAPVAGGVVSFSGEMLMETRPAPIELDSTGKGVFNFLGGMADLTSGVRNLSTMISIDNLSYYSEDFGVTGLSAYVLGGRSTGTDFVTAANDKVDFILHDPPGSNSYAYIEKGTVFTTTTEITSASGIKGNGELAASIGFEVETIAGFGVMTGFKTEFTTKIGGKIEIEGKTIDNNTYMETTTFTDRIQTSAETDFVGHQADIYVGRGMNTLYGLTNNITIGKTDAFIDPDNKLRTEGNYTIGKQTAIAMGMDFGTEFYYTGYEIENIMIPKWKDLLKNKFVFSDEGINTATIENPVYVSKLPANHPNFGKRNDDEAFGQQATNDLENGPSYTMILPDALRAKMAAGWKVVEQAKRTVEVTDSVMYLNQKIKQWEKILANNERRKVDAIENRQYKPGDNISFGSGVTIEKSKTFEEGTGWTNGFEYDGSMLLVTETMAKICGVGVEGKTETGTVENERNTTTNDTLKSNTVGFVLAETGTTDQITVDYTLDAASVPNTFMFRTRGGRTSCPYEAEVRTKYYKPDYIINEGTMQIEIPKIAVSSGVYRLQVPAARAASFTLDITNESETNGTGWFKLTVDESSNPHGAVLKIDGAPIGNGRYFSVPSGTVLKKTLTLEKGPDADVYENVRLILASDCSPDLSDEIMITAEFLPSCSYVGIKSPSNNWIINNNTGDSVMVELENLDINYASFGYVELLYRQKSSSQWTSEMKFYANQERYNQAQGKKTLLGNGPTIKYWWHKDQKPDGEYELAAHTVCETVGNIFIADYTTPAVSGTMDLTRPAALGLPSPASGIMGIGDELSITYNEDIQTGMLTQNNFSISGVLNGEKIAEPSAGIAFAGGSQYARTELPVYTGGSFSIEAWFKHDVGAGGALFNYGGSNNNGISLGFDATGRAVLKVGAETHTSTVAIANDETWKYIAMAYNHETNSVSVYEYEGATDKVLFNERKLVSNPPTQGSFAVGEGFTGAVSGLHIYGVSRTQADVSASKNLVKSGREYGLIGYWPLDEIEGTVAEDKVRARNLMLGAADWYIYPSGRAKRTNGNYFAISTATYPLHAFSDFTLEFWFRSENANQQNKVLFSNDNGYIAINATGGLTLYKNDGTVNRVLTSTNLINTKWHHVAMSVRRGGNVNVYVDGAVTATFSETLLGSFASSHYYFGAKRTPPNTYGDYFSGYFDEIRIWNSALTRDGIMLNKNSKLRGTEAGLMAYYPFESYTKQSNGLITVTQTNSNMVADGEIAAGTAVLSTTAVPVKDARPVENVPFTYVASNNKIVFTLEPSYFARVEGTTLTVAVKDVRDMRDNKSNTEQWTAFIRRNSLRWDSDPIYLSVEEGKTGTFTAKITNIGGTSVSYNVENLPSWLRVANGTGNLAPMASKELTFTVQSGVNIGNYEAAIGLASGNGITEVLSVQLKVSGESPNWIVNPNDFEGSMSITGQIKVNGVFSENTEDILAAFIGNECVGKATLTYINPSNAYFVFFSIYGNAEHSNKPITFKLWRASTGRTYPKVETSISDIRFASGSILGSPANAVVFNALDVYEQVIALRKGWNWISANVQSETPSILNQVKSALSSAGVMIKGQNGYTQRSSANWIGSLPEISEKSLYLVNVNNNISLSLAGQRANPSTSVDINNGWNWIGYIPQFSLPVKNALAGINAQTGDIVKGQNGYAVYLGAGGWVGTLTYMQTGSGYMYNSNNAAAQTLVYPSEASQGLQIQPLGKKSAVQMLAGYNSRWSVDQSRFSSSMTITSVVMDGYDEIRSEQIEIGAFSGSECRGSTTLRYVPGEDKYVGFLLVYGEGNEEIKLKVYDHAEAKEYNAVNNAINYTADAIYGTPDFYVVNLRSMPVIGPATYTVTFNANGGTVSPTSAKTSADGKLSSLPTPTRTGNYEFDGWYTASTGGARVTANTSFNSNTIVYAQWTTFTSYTVTFNAGGGSVSPTSAATGADGTLGSLPTPTRTGNYEFDGWYTASTGGARVAANTSFNANTAIYAQWTTFTSYTIMFNANGGTVSPTSAKTVADGTLGVLPEPEKSGYTFDGWYTASTGGTEVTESYVFGGNGAIYARWTLVTYTITFDAAGGTVTPASGVTGVGGRLTALPTPTKADCFFEGWFTEPAGVVKVTSSTAFDGDAAIYAQWTPVYTVTFDAAGGSLTISTKKTGGGGKLSSLPTPVRAGGYKFEGWYMIDGTDSVKVVSSTVFDCDAVVYAKWLPPIAVGSPDREVPVNPSEKVAIAAPANRLAAEFAAGPNPAGRSFGGAVNFFRSGAAVKSAALYVYDASGNVVKSVDVKDGGAAVGGNGRRAVGSWDLTDKKGRPVPEGTYLVRGVVKTKDGKTERVSAVVGVR